MNAANFATQNHTHELARQGWTSAGNDRGTMDILWSAGVTIALCSWTALCLNVPPMEWGTLRNVYQKGIMACFSILCPECINQIALCQWWAARCSVEEFRASGISTWTMEHAFLAEMGAFVLRPKDKCSPAMRGRDYFVLNAKSVHYLVTKGYIPVGDILIDRRLIQEKNKGDGISRIIAVVQMTWFTFSTIGRAAMGLPITIIELIALGFVVCTFGTYFFWLHKPLDVRCPIFLEPELSLAEILKDAGKSVDDPYDRTPLGFTGDHWSAENLYFRYGMSIFRMIGFRWAHDKPKPWTKIPDDNFSNITGWPKWLLFFFHALYAGVHLSGWNFDFPTSTERTLWHVATVAAICGGASFWLTEWIVWTLMPYLRKRRIDGGPGKTELPFVGSPFIKRRFTDPRNRLQDWLRNLPGPVHDPKERVQLKAVLPVAFGTGLYWIARAYILCEAVISIRSLPVDAYRTVWWSSFLPHA